MAQRTILVATPRGFCAGVSYAIDIVKLALEHYGVPVYVRHEIVHNHYVVDDLRAKGAIFVDDLNDVPIGSLLIFSAHGVSPQVRDVARQRDLRVIDATCPLVTKVHLQVLKHARENLEIILIGHRGHVEVEGTMGHAPERMYLVEKASDVAALQIRDAQRLAVVTQTTLSVDDTTDIIAALKRRFPAIRTPPVDDICYATQNRQVAVKSLARASQLVLVLGSPISSNANRLVEVARAEGAESHLIDSEGDIEAAWMARIDTVGLSAGASTPEHLVQSTIRHLKALGFATVRDLVTAEEDISFPLPRELRRLSSSPE